MKSFRDKSKAIDTGGYTLLFAVLVATLVLGVAVFILSISRGQYILSSTARESTYAIYAADSGIECTAKAAVYDLSTTSGGTYSCAGQAPVDLSDYIFEGPVSINGLSEAYHTSYYLDLGNERCAQITYIKGFDGPGGSGNVVTQIESRGYNLCGGSGATVHPLVDNSRIVERAIRLTYTGL